MNLSDAMTDIARDGYLQKAVAVILRKWVLGEDYLEDMKKLRKLPKGYWYPSGEWIARDLENGVFCQRLTNPKERLVFLAKHQGTSVNKLRKELMVKEELKCLKS